MTSHPPEPPAQWPSPFPEDGPAGRGQRPGTPDEPPDGDGQRSAAPDEWPPGPRRRYPADLRGNGHRAAAAYPANGMPPPLADHPPEAGHRRAPGHPAGVGSGPGGYPDLPDYPQNTYSPQDTYFSGYPPMPDYPPAPGYEPAGYPPNGYPAEAHPANGYPAEAHPANGYPAGPYPVNGHPPEAYPGAGQPPGGYPAGGHPAGGSQVVEFPAADDGWAAVAAPVTHEEYLHPGYAPAAVPDALRVPPAPAGPAAPGAAPDGAHGPARAVPRAASWAMLGYLTVPFCGFLVPLAIYLMSLRRSRWLRANSAQAVNLSLTVLLYELSAAIIGAMLVLDSPVVALAVTVPLAVALWLTALAFLVRAALAARRGDTYTFPRWLCTPMLR
jgi:uncharacterized Tic20 family protein